MAYQHVLLIDDDEDDQEIFLSALDELTNSIRFTAISNAELALQKLESKRLLVDLIFLDLNMPIMDGKQFLIRLMKNGDLKNIPVIVFSTSSNDHSIKEIKELGAHDFITKPAKFIDLKSILKSIIE